MAGNLWFNDEGGRWFVVPDECKARSGTLKVRDLHGDERTLDPEQALPWEVDDAEGRALLEADMRVQAEQVESVLGGMVQALGGHALNLNNEEDASDAVAAAFKGLLGALGGALSSDPVVAQRAQAKLGAVAAEISRDPEHQERLETMGREARSTVLEAMKDLEQS